MHRMPEMEMQRRRTSCVQPSLTSCSTQATVWHPYSPHASQPACPSASNAAIRQSSTLLNTMELHNGSALAQVDDGAVALPHLQMPTPAPTFEASPLTCSQA